MLSKTSTHFPMLSIVRATCPCRPEAGQLAHAVQNSQALSAHCFAMARLCLSRVQQAITMRSPKDCIESLSTRSSAAARMCFNESQHVVHCSMFCNEPLSAHDQYITTACLDFIMYNGMHAPRQSAIRSVPVDFFQWVSLRFMTGMHVLH